MFTSKRTKTSIIHMNTKNIILFFTFQILRSSKYHHQITYSKIWYSLHSIVNVCMYGFLYNAYLCIYFIYRQIFILYTFTFYYLYYLYKHLYISFHSAWGEGQTNISLSAPGVGVEGDGTAPTAPCNWTLLPLQPLTSSGMTTRSLLWPPQPSSFI